MSDDDFASVTGLDRELIPVRPPAPGRCPPAPITPEQAVRHRAEPDAALTAHRRAGEARSQAEPVGGA
ncbi:hypothetical protein GCM10027160_35130 [Streptomyces calidiresistens]